MYAAPSAMRTSPDGPLGDGPLGDGGALLMIGEDGGIGAGAAESGAGRVAPGWRTRAFSTKRLRTGSPGRNRSSCPARAFSSLRARSSHSLCGLGFRSPSEQMVLWRGPFGVWTDSTRRELV